MSITAVIVEDALTELNQIVRILARAGIDVVGTARDGQSGLDMIRQLRPTIASLDLMLPLVEGLEIARIVQAEKIPTYVFIASGSGQGTIKTIAAGYGVLDFFVKPWDDILTTRTLIEKLAEVGITLREDGAWQTPTTFNLKLPTTLPPRLSE